MTFLERRTYNLGGRTLGWRDFRTLRAKMRRVMAAMTEGPITLLDDPADLLWRLCAGDGLSVRP